MNNTTDMSTPVTRGELREELASLESRFDLKLVDLESRLDHKLDLWGGALLAHITASERRLLDELARHAGAIEESLSRQVAVVDEKYRDLPDRVSQLETQVFPVNER